jgi:hypothetical protein
MIDKFKCSHGVSGRVCQECWDNDMNELKSQAEIKSQKNLAAREALRKIEFSLHFSPSNSHFYNEKEIYVCPNCRNERHEDHANDCNILKIWEALLY